jgi:DNA-damage-inducible protein J
MTTGPWSAPAHDVLDACVCGHNGVPTVATDTVVRARIDGQVKAEAAEALGKIGLSVSDAIRMLMIRIAKEKALPFDVNIPNERTRAAIRELENGGGETFENVEALMIGLNKDD